MSRDRRTPEEKARAKRVHALVMMVMGGIMTACALAGGLILLSGGGDLPGWMYGRFRRGASVPPRERVPGRRLVRFTDSGPDVFRRARTERKLVLLHLTAFWSRDGRVMEETTYADPQVAAWLRDNAVAARVDADERPGLAARYLSGPPPATILLLPDGRAAAQGGFLTPKLFLPWAEMISRAARDPAKAETLALSFERARQAATPPVPEPLAALLSREDHVWGGFYRFTRTSSGGREHAKTLQDQAEALERLGDQPEAARRLLDFTDRFLALSEGGYAASARGEVRAANGRVIEGDYYFQLGEAARRRLGLPEADRRLLSGPCARMARAVLSSPWATSAQRLHARRTLQRL